MNYEELHWCGDMLLGDINVSDQENVIGLYRINKFPQILIYMDIENEKIYKVELDEYYEEV